MKIKNIATIAAIAGVISLSGLAVGAYAHSRSGGSGSGFSADRITDRIDKHLDLTDEQESEIEKLLAARVVKIQDEIGIFKQDASVSFADSEFSADDAKSLIMDAEGMHERIRTHLAETLAEVHGVLTPEQRQEAVALLNDHESWFGAHGKSWFRGHRESWFRGHHGDRDRDGHHGRKH